MKAYVCRFLYILIASRLPSSWAMIGGPLWKKIREITVRGFVTYAGKEINIQRKVVLTSRISIGDLSGIGKYSVVDGPITIGKYVNIGEQLRVVTQNHRTDRTDIPMQQQGYTEEKEVVIGDDVWIGHRVILLPGVHIGKGSVIGAGAVVTRDIPEYSVAGGVPARIIKNRKA
ncbi:MAG: CatB-related O-acetyltransferase [Clostridia bacterium]|nr:CatB-related O-acetyltransferase [Clostridia bacterium]